MAKPLQVIDFSFMIVFLVNSTLGRMLHFAMLPT